MKYSPVISALFLSGALLDTIQLSIADAATNSASVIDLPTALQLAGAQNLDLQIARERLAEAKVNQAGALWQFFPALVPGVSYRRHDDLIQNVEGRILDVHKDSYTVGPSLAGQLDLGEAIYRHLAARQLVKASDFALESQRFEALLSAAHGYFDLMKARHAENVGADALRISTNYVGQLQQAVSGGLAFKGDVLRAQVQAERNRAILRQAQEQQRLASARLAQTLHLDPAVELFPRDEQPITVELIDIDAALDSLVALAVSNRPELQQNTAFAEAARHAKNSAVYGPLFPQLGAQVFVGGLGGGPDGGEHRFGMSEDYALTLGWRIGPGGLFDRSRARATESRLAIAELNRAKAYDEVVRQVIENQSRLLSLNDQLGFARNAVEQAGETLRLSQQRKEFAIGAVLEVLQAEQELTRARLDFVNLTAEFNKSQFALLKAIGRYPPGATNAPTASTP
jgi:outer membrane protein TolC